MDLKEFNNNQIQNDSGIPLYYQVKEILIQKISDGVFKEGKLIPTEDKLANEYNVSKGTIRRAMADLVNSGFLFRRSGFGTIVKNQKLEYTIGIGKLNGFFDILKEKGLTPSTKVLDFDIKMAEEAGVAKTLSLSENDKVYSITRIRYANGEALYLEHFYLPYEKFSGLSKEELNFNSLYDLLRNRFKVSLTKSKQFIEPVVVDDYEALVLGIKKGSPAMMLEGIIYAENNNTILISRDIIRGDKCRYYFELSF